MDSERREKWIKNQDALMDIHKMLLIPYQGIALIDAMLIIEDKNITDRRLKGEEELDLRLHLTQSYLWVLGAYEIIRTMSDYADKKNNEDTKINPFKEDIRKLKHKFEFIRMPLAKFEAAKRNPEGHTYAHPMFHPDLGTCWIISDRESISRKLLSDSFLELMEKLSN